MSANDFLPITREDVIKRGWEQLDFLYICGDAYVDHPSFGHAIITRVLESIGFKVGIIAQPDWRSVDDFIKLGRPKYGVIVSAGNLDSMVNHYTSAKKRRSKDVYSPGGDIGKRPDRAVIVYCNRVKEAFKDIPIIIGGIEASLRRFAHYDYWDDSVRRSIMVDSKADLLIYGMGEKAIIEVAEALESGMDINHITYISGTCYVSDNIENIGDDYLIIPSFKQVKGDKQKHAEACKIQYEEQDPIRGRVLIQAHGNRYIIQNPPMTPLSKNELDAVYALPYQREFHPIYGDKGGVPAIEEVQFSITASRGCFGSCSFCALAFHQGRIIQSRSKASIVNEAEKITWLQGFKGYIHDVGGPTANFIKPACEKQLSKGTCLNKRCLSPVPCKNLKVSHDEYLDILRSVRELPNVKKVFVRSGIRYDYLVYDNKDTFIQELCEHHISGQLKVAPEHISEKVLRLMGKPTGDIYKRFVEKFKNINKKLRKEQYLVPYLMSSHPGSGLNEAIELAEFLRDSGYSPEQVQDFYPTPGTISTCMFYTGIDPLTMQEVYIPRSAKEKAMQRALLQYRNPSNYSLVFEALVKAGRNDLIGFGPKCLIKSRKVESRKSNNKISKKRG